MAPAWMGDSLPLDFDRGMTYGEEGKRGSLGARLSGGGQGHSRPPSPSNHRAPPTSSSSSSSSSQAAYLSTIPSRSVGPLASRRARQIQADEGILPASYRPPAMRQGASSAEQQGTSLHPHSGPSDNGRAATTDSSNLEAAGSRLFRGRARAGTLPSSWGNESDSSLVSSAQAFGSAGGMGVIGDGSSGARGGRPWSQSLSQQSPLASNNSSEAGARSTSTVQHAPTTYSHYSSLPASNANLSTNRIASRQLRSNSALEFDKVGSLYHQIGSDSSGSSNFSPPSSFDTSGTTASLQSNRLRSGSLASTLSGLGNNAFGPSLFSSTWSEQPGQSRLSSSTARPLSRRSSALGAAIGSTSEESVVRNRLSFELNGDNQTMQDEQHLDGSQEVHTLDYLGLEQDDSGQSRHSLGQQRNRASTMASVPPRASNGATGSSQNLTLGRAERRLSGEDAGLLGDLNNDDFYASYALQHGLDPTQVALVASAVGLQGGNGASSQPGRLRAGTVATLSGPGGRQRIEQELQRMATMANGASSSALGANSLLAASLRGQVGGGESRYSKAPLEGFPHLEIGTPPITTPSRSSPFHTSPPTPATAHSLGNGKVGVVDEGGSGGYPPWSHSPSSATALGPVDFTISRSTNQLPSRSLWIGNLDSSTTGQELMRVFAPYGAIESLRLLPEKECGFVNFVETGDAIRARDDVLGRLGARLDHLGTGSGGTVRVGYGKIDSVPSHSFKGGAGALGQGSYGLDSMHSSGDPASAPMTPGGSEGVGPTRALWVGSIPSSVTPAVLLSIFQPFGPVESARILTHKNCGFVNFERVDDAVRARKMLNGRDVLGSEVGAMRIGFAKVPARNVESYPTNGIEGAQYEAAVDSLASLKGAKSVTKGVDQQMQSGGLENYRSNLIVNLLNQEREMEGGKAGAGSNAGIEPVSSLASSQTTSHVSRHSTSASTSIVPASDKGGVPLPPHMAAHPSLSDLQLLMSHLSAGQASREADVASVAHHRPSSTYYMTIPLVSEVSSGRRFETSKLRETRRSIESGQVGTRECDLLALDYLDSIVDLASDYIGNTLVQKFFENCSENVKTEMLQRLAPHLAMTGCHKNGTWAAQKILDCSKSPDQITLIAQHLRPYIPGLLLDQFGNYVVQCCLPWMQPLNDFVFDAMVDRCWEIAQGRFGARSMRACLEKESVTDQQRKRVAMAVILNSVPLATSPNGSILLTWLLETSGLSKSYKLLAPRFAPHLSHLCTHKLASTPVMRLVNQKLEPEASLTILNALFESSQDQVLEEVVIDQVHGSQFVTKVLTSSVLTREQRDRYAAQVQTLVEKHRLVGVPAYRRLCEDLGLTAPAFSNAPSASSSAYSQPATPSSYPLATYPGLLPVLQSSGMPANVVAPLSSMHAPTPAQDAFNPCWDPTSPLVTHPNVINRRNP